MVVNTPNNNGRGESNLASPAKTTTTPTAMKEIPFLQHLSPISLSGGNGNGNGSQSDPKKSQVSSKNNGDGTRRYYTVATIGSNGYDNAISNVPHGAFGLVLWEQSSSSSSGNNCNDPEARMPIMASDLNNSDYNKLPPPSNAPSSAANNFLMEKSAEEQRQLMLGLTSSTYSQYDDTLICTNGMMMKGNYGLMRITTRHAAATTGSNNTSINKTRATRKGQDVFVDLSPLLNNNYNEDDDMAVVTTIVKTACFLTHPNNHYHNHNETDEEHVKGWSPTTRSSNQSTSGNNNSSSWLHVHMMTSKGAMIRVVFSYPTLTPSSAEDTDDPFASFIYYPNNNVSIGHGRQVCFPTPTTVVYTTDTNENDGCGGTLYCIDLGDALNQSNSGTTLSSITTRVWSALHKTIVPPPPSSFSQTGTTTNYSTCNTPSGVVRKLDGTHLNNSQSVARKKARYSLGNVLSSVYTMVVGGDGGVNEEYEYKDDDIVVVDSLEQQGEGTTVLPSIAAVTSLNGTNGTNIHGDGVARVATVHTDGSLCIWVAETTRRRKKFHYTDNDGTSSSFRSVYRPRLRIPSVQCVDSNVGGDILPSFSSSSSVEITLRGQYNLDDHSYQVALCCGSGSDGTNSNTTLRLFRGESFSNFDEDDEISFGKTAVQDLTLPSSGGSGGGTVVDVAWDNGADLLVLFRQVGSVVVGDGNVSLAVYPLLKNSENGSFLYSDPVLPSNMTLKQYGMNHTSSSLGLTASEELNRYVDLSSMKSNTVDDDMELDDTPSSVIDTAQLEANIDRAGLLAILQPFGRSRPSALAVYRAMFRLGLLVNTPDVQLDDIHPASIVLAMRNWKKRDEFEASHPSFATSLVPREGSPLPSPHHGGGDDAKKHSNKSSHVSDDEEEDFGNNGKTEELGQNSYTLKWTRLLSEIRREELQLNDVVSISSVPISPSSSMNVLMRVGMVSMLKMDDSVESTLINEDEKLMAALDELSLDLITAVMDDPDCRQALSVSETLIYNAASKASPLVSSWSSNDLGNDLMVQIGNVGSLAMAKMTLTEHQVHLLRIISELDLSFAEKWLQSPSSLSASVTNRLAITKTFATMPNSNEEEELSSCDADALGSATSLISSMVESSRLLSLSRLIIVSCMPQSVPVHLHNNALRSVLYSTALSWAFKQSSSDDKSRTILDEYLSHEMTKAFYSSGVTTAMHLADMCIASSFSFLSNESSDNLLLQLVSPSHEPRIALRLLAPLVEYPNFASLDNDQKRKEVTAECLLAEAAVVAKLYDKDATKTSPKELLSLAADFLSDSISLESLGTTNFNEIFECLKGNRATWWTFEAEPHHEGLLYEALTAILQIGDDDGVDSSTPETEEEIQRLCTMQTVKSLFLPLALCSEGISVDQSFIDGNAWRNIPRISMYNFVKTLMKVSNLIHCVDTIGRYLNLGSGEKSLPPCCAVVLEAVDDAITSITSTLPPQMCRDMPELSKLYSVAFQTSVGGRLWDEALKACTSNSGDDEKSNLKHLIVEMVRVGDIGKLVDMSLTVVGGSGDLFQFVTKIVEEAALEQKDDADTCLDYWGCLYTLHASRGNWKRAAEAMDLCGKVTVSSALSKPTPLARGASKRIMDQASLSAHVCSHAVSLVEKLPNQYMRENRGTILTKEDIDRRAVRASALRALSMDECSPDSISSILNSHSLDTIDILARMGYYEHAIAVAAGVSSKRRSNPSGVDVFFDSLRHILRTYLVPAAIGCTARGDEDNQLDSRSKVIQMQASSSICEQEMDSSTTTSITSYSQSWESSDKSAHSLQAATAMNLLYQYTTSYSKRCSGLGLSVASAILDLSGNTVLPIWLKDLCMFGSPSNGGNLFAQRNCDSSVADPSALIRLLMSHHKYGDSCDVVTAILSSRASSSSASSRLPEKGNVDYVPYDLIDSLWQIIEVIASSSASESEETHKKIQMLLQSRSCMERSLAKHFEDLKISEDGLRSARTLSNNA